MEEITQFKHNCIDVQGMKGYEIFKVDRKNAYELNDAWHIRERVVVRNTQEAFQSQIKQTNLMGLNFIKQQETGRGFLVPLGEREVCVTRRVVA